MKPTPNHIINIIIVTIILTGCASFSSSDTITSVQAENLFTEIYKDCTMNQDLILEYIGHLYEGDNSINLRLKSVTDKSVIFPNDHNVSILFFNDSNTLWIEIQNNMQYLPLDAKYIVGQNDPIKEHSSQLINIIPEIEKQANLRVVVRGNVYENRLETDKCTGAYIDFEFIP